MIKIVFCLRRKPDMSVEEFDRYWREDHAPLVRTHAESLGIRRYVQTSHTPHDFGAGAARARGAPEPFDGVAELWFDDWDAVAAGFSTPEGRAAGKALMADEEKFIDFANSPIFFATEREIIAWRG